MVYRVANYLKEGNITEETLYATFSLKDRIAIATGYSPEFIDLKNECLRRDIEFISHNEAWKILTEENEELSLETRKKLAGMYLSQEQIRIFSINNGFAPDITTELTNGEYIAELLEQKKIPKDYIAGMVCKISDDNLKIQCMKKYVPRVEHDSVIHTLIKDESKIQCLKLSHFKSLPWIVSSFVDDKNKEKYINLLPYGKGEMIDTLKDDKLREKYLNKYFGILSGTDKGNIIGYFKDESYIRKYYNRLKSGTAIKAFFDSMSVNGIQKYQLFDVKKELIGRLKKEKDFYYLLTYVHEPELRDMLLSKIHSSELLEQIAWNSEQSCSDVSKLIDKPNDKVKEKMLINLGNDFPFKAFDLLHKIKNINGIINVMGSLKDFPMYDDKYEFLVDQLSKKYNLNREHLLRLAKNVGCAVFTRLGKQNIKDIINADEEAFSNLLRIFNPESYGMTETMENDVLNSFLQRKFRIEHPNIYNARTRILSYANYHEYEQLLQFLTRIDEYIGLSNYGTSVQELFEELKGEKTKELLTKLSVITDKYIRVRRSEYVQQHIADALDNSTDLSYEKNAFIANLIKKETENSLIYRLSRPVNGVDYADRELALINNMDLLKKLIKFRKDPKNAEALSVEDKKSLPVLFTLIEKAYSRRVYKPTRSSLPVKHEIAEPKSVCIVDILEDINIKQLKDTLFNEEELFNDLLAFLKRYSILGWGTRFELEAEPADVVCKPTVLAALVNNYKSVKKRVEAIVNEEEKKEQVSEKNKEKAEKKIILTEMIDRAAVYDTASYRYYALFGQDNFFYFRANPAPYKGDFKFADRIACALAAIPEMFGRKSIPVPAKDADMELSNGKKINVVIGNVTDLINLTLGERTGACTRFGGANDALFRFCNTDSHGFQINFYDPDDGKFVSRISCYRNGNTVYMNQLRFSLLPKYTSKDLIEATKMIAKELVEKTKNDEVPIDNVLVGDGYVFYEANEKKTTFDKQLMYKGLSIDYADIEDGAILLATTSEDGSLVPINPDVKTPEYKPQRGKIKTYTGKAALEQVQHFQMLELVTQKKSIDSGEVINDKGITTCIFGDDWYISIDTNGKINKFVLSKSQFKQEALLEMQNTLMKLNEHLEVQMEEAQKLA